MISTNVSAGGASYHSFMQFDAIQYPEMMGSLNIDKAFVDKSLFGNEKESANAIVQQALLTPSPTLDPVSDLEASSEPLPELLTNASKISDKLRGLRRYSNDVLKATKQLSDKAQERSSVDKLDRSLTDLSIKGNSLPSNQQLHERLLISIRDTKGFPKDAQVVLDHAMLFRAKEKYLFDYSANKEIIADDPWLGELWDWVAGIHIST